jgi:hypothetical protein
MLTVPKIDSGRLFIEQPDARAIRVRNFRKAAACLCTTVASGVSVSVFWFFLFLIPLSLSLLYVVSKPLSERW